MTKKVIAIDVDEVLFPFVEMFSRHHNQKYGTNFTIDDFITYEFQNVLGLNTIETVERVYAFHRLSDSHIKPLEKARESIVALSQKYSIAVVTARHPQFGEQTKAWMDIHFDTDFHDLVAIGYEKVMERPRTKAEVCSELNAVALIDDSLDNVSGCAGAGIQGILFGDYPWNRTGELPQGVVRCRNWEETLRFLDVIK